MFSWEQIIEEDTHMFFNVLAYPRSIRYITIQIDILILSRDAIQPEAITMHFLYELHKMIHCSHPDPLQLSYHIYSIMLSSVFTLVYPLQNHFKEVENHFICTWNTSVEWLLHCTMIYSFDIRSSWLRGVKEAMGVSWLQYIYPHLEVKKKLI